MPAWIEQFDGPEGDRVSPENSYFDTVVDPANPEDPPPLYFVGGRGQLGLGSDPDGEYRVSASASMVGTDMAAGTAGFKRDDVPSNGGHYDGYVLMTAADGAFVLGTFTALFGDEGATSSAVAFYNFDAEGDPTTEFTLVQDGTFDITAFSLVTDGTIVRLLVEPVEEPFGFDQTWDLDWPAPLVSCDIGIAMSSNVPATTWVDQVTLQMGDPPPAAGRRRTVRVIPRHR